MYIIVIGCRENPGILEGYLTDIGKYWYELDVKIHELASAF